MVMPNQRRVGKIEKEEGEGKIIGRGREKRERKSACYHQNFINVHADTSWGLCTLPAKEPMQLLDRHNSTGTAPVATGLDMRCVGIGQEVQNPGLGCARDCGDRLDWQHGAGSRWFRQEHGQDR